MPSRPTLLFAALFVALPAVVFAAAGLVGTMKQWNGGDRAAGAMLTGHAAYSADALRATLTAYVADGNRLAARANGNSAEARDFHNRFLSFAADSQAALAVVGDPHAESGAYSRISGDCQSCHNIYRN